MCFIYGLYNFENQKLICEKILKKAINRGPDNSKIVEYKKFIFSHNLLAINNFEVQPIQNKNLIFLGNFEIYNFLEIKKKLNLKSKTEQKILFELFEKFSICKKTLNLIRGFYAICHFDKNKKKLVLARDKIGESPLFYFFNKEKKTFGFSSEKKYLINLDKNIFEVKPSEILTIDFNNFSLKKIDNFLKFSNKNLDENYSKIKSRTKNLLINSIKQMSKSDKKIGVLFSGGIDSTFICYVLKKLKVPFTCYTSYLSSGNIKEASDLIYSKEIAKKYGFDLKIKKVELEELKKDLKKIIDLIEDEDYIKVSVASPFFYSLKLAKKDGVKIIFSGLGSEEIFAGYKRHKNAIEKKINEECYNGLKTIHKRDLYRDNVLAMNNSMEIRLPFLDLDLINYSLKIPSKFKISEDKKQNKLILRDIAKDLGLDEKYCNRLKKAAQYGSKFDKGFLKISKEMGVSGVKQLALSKFNI